MIEDLEVALKAGETVVRIGTAILAFRAAYV
jgi:uncharacterized pyridoxal phosphate-containing UPF0001 family protein